MRTRLMIMLSSLVWLLLSAPPALAAEDAVESEGFGSGQWDGLILALVVGVVIGGLVVAAAGGEPAPDHQGEEAVHG